MDQPLIGKIFDSYANVNTIVWVGLPAALFVWSFLKSCSYRRDNLSFHNQLKDILDRQVFQGIIAPLFSFINRDLSQEIANNLELKQINDNQQFLKVSDEKKEGILKQRDFSYLEKAIEFQDAIDRLLESKKNQIALKSFIKICKRALITLTVTSFLTLIIGAGWVAAYKIFDNKILSWSFGIAWGFFFILSLIFGAVFYYKSIQIENLNK